MPPKINKLTKSRRLSESQSCSSRVFSHSSVRDSAVLLLSIADIAKSELDTSGFSSLWNDSSSRSLKQHPLLLPSFPLLSTSDQVVLSPRSADPQGAIRSRVRSVSMDAVDWKKETKSIESRAQPNKDSNPVRKQSLRLSTKTKREYFSDSAPDSSDESQTSSPLTIRPRSVSLDPVGKRGKVLQATPPKNVAVQVIYRKKFSWKNYPELERFLIANREEYLKHSALNYTIQQKQYNNRLTENLLELATVHGYMFDTTDFGFVTVRDRIRCYFKSYVQSAKKRGILMGYAARKAGLLDTKDLQEKTNGEIYTP